LPVRLARDSPEQRGPPVALPNRLTRCTAQCARGVLDASARDYPASRLGPGDPPSVRASSRRTRYCRPQRVSQRTVGPRPAPSPDPGSDAAAVLWYRARSSGRGGADQRDSRPRARPAVSRRSIFPKGTPYSAHDPALLAWVHATLLEMNLRAYELFVGPLTLPSRPTSDRRKRGQFRGSYHGSTGSSLIRCDREQSPAAPALKGRLPGCALAHANRDINEIFRKVTPNFRRL
jgi:ER-bound oxygenase mpaB/B'/Rubber oxygenase, catalytic domain